MVKKMKPQCGWKCSSMAESLPRMCAALGSMPSTREGEGRGNKGDKERGKTEKKEAPKVPCQEYFST